MDWTYPLLVGTLVQAVGLSILLILIPLRFLEPTERVHCRCSRMVFYFLCLGLAFLFVEMAFIQKFTLLLSHPVYAAAVVLCAFLVFAGFGSRFAGPLQLAADPSWQRLGIRSPVTPPVLGIILFSALDPALLPLLFRHCMVLPVAFKIPVSLLLIAPLAFCMGMPFPLGLSRVAQQMPDFIPWDWGINGCASVMSAVLATILAIHFGFNAVVGMAALLYVPAALFFPGD